MQNLTKEQKLQEKQEIAAQLKEMLEKANFTVYTKLNHVSGSGMTRYISAYITTPEGNIQQIDWFFSKVLGEKINTKWGGLKLEGCGMDMGFEMVYRLSTHLYRNQDGSYSHDGAYKLNQRWL